MADDTLQDVLTEQGLLNAINAATTKLNEACAIFTDTLTALAEHKVDGAAHTDIRDQIVAVIDATGFATADYVNSTVITMVGAHNTDTTVHGYLQEKINNITTRVGVLEEKVNELIPDEDEETTMEQKIAAIEDKYRDILYGLLMAFMAADINSTDNKQDILNEYQATMALRTAEIEAIYEEYNYA